MAGGIIAEKKIVVKAVDEVTEPLARMNQKLSEFESKFGQLDSKMSSAVTAQQSFKGSLNAVRASLDETATASKKTAHSISEIKGKNVKIEANTTEANSKVSSFDKKLSALRKEKPTIKPEVNTTEAEKGLGRFRRSIKATDRAGSTLKNFIGGNLIANGIQSAASSVEQLVVQGFRAAEAGSLLTARWKQLGMAQPEIKATSATVRDLKENTDMSGTAVGNLITRFYGMTGSASRARTLAKGVGSITDALKLGPEASDAFANGLTRIESSGKVTRQSLGRIERQVPGLIATLQKASGMSKQSFDDLLDSGKMTADQFNNIMARASKDYGKNAAAWTSTTQGATKKMQQSWSDAWQAIMGPVAKAAAPAFGALSNALAKLQPEFTELGKGIANVTEKFAKWLTPQHAKDLGMIVGSLGKMALALGKGVWKAAMAPFALIGKVINLMAGKHGDALDDIAKGLDAISKNKVALTILEGIGMILTTQFAYSKLFKIADGLGLINKALVNAGKAKFTGNIFKDFVRGLKKFKNFKGDSSFTKAVGPKGVLTQEAEKGGDSAGQGFMSRMFSRLKGTKVGSRFSSMFKGITREATTSGDEAGGSFVTRLLSKVKGVKVEGLGRGLGSKLGGAFALAFGAIDLFKALSSKKDKAAKVGKSLGETAGGMGGAEIGASLGSVVPGIGTLIGGLLGGLIGSKAGGMIGEAIGKCWGTIKKGAAAVGKFIFNTLTWPFKAAFKVGEWFGDKVKGILHHNSKQPSQHERPSQHEIKSLGGNNYSKTDIANIKEMNKAVTTYTGTLKKLKSAVKKNDPTKSLNKMNKGLKNFVKGMAKSAKPLSSLAKTFKTFGKSTETMASSIKSLTGKHGLGEFTKDLKQLNKGMKNTKVGTYFEKLSKSIKKSKLADTIKKLDKWLDDMVNDWKHLDKPLKNATKEFTTFEKTISKLSNKKTGISKVDTDIKTLAKDLRKYDFSKTLSEEMNAANKAIGKNGFVKQFSNMVNTVQKSLRSFSKDFNKYWGDAWKNLSKDARNGLRRAENTITGKLDDISDDGRNFERGFKRSWSDWLDDLVSAFKSGFGKLPGIASKSMSEIVSRLNKGISGINKVIGDFGGDKKLGTISYARGTFAHPGGKAIVNDGLEPNKTELMWQPSKGWGTVSGQNVAYDLEAGSVVLNAKHSQPFLQTGMFPHYADGTLSDDEMDKIAEAFENNPVNASRNLILKLTNWTSSVPIIPSLGKSLAIGFSRGIANVLKDLLGEVKNPVNGDWTPVIRSAAAHMGEHLSAYDIKRILNTIAHESGGNQGIPGIDDHDGTGRALGLLQYKRETFDHYKVNGHGNIFSGYDQLLALFNDSNWRGDLRWNGGWGPTGSRRRAMGGHVTALEHSWLGDNPEHDEYVINPYNSNALPLMEQAWHTMELNRPELRSTEQGGQFNGQVVTLLREAVNAIKSIDLQPVMNLDETTKAINKQNAKDWRMA